MNVIGFERVKIKTESNLDVYVNIALLDDVINFTDTSVIVNYQGIIPTCPVLLKYNSSDTPLPDIWGDGVNVSYRNNIVTMRHNDITYELSTTLINSTRCIYFRWAFKDADGKYFVFSGQSLSDGGIGNIVNQPSVNEYGSWYYPSSFNWYFQVVGLTADVLLNINTLANKLLSLSESSDPYERGGTSSTGGGTGTFDLSSDSIDFPSLPTLTAVSTGLVSIYTPTLTQLNSLASFLWNANPTDVDWWKKLVANPLDLILGLSIVPVAVPAGAAQNIKVGLIDTGVSVTKAATQFVTVDCGSINVAEVWGSALDYSPFTKFSIYLPFIGTRTINTDDIMGKTVHVKYNVDLLSGACTAMVKCGGSVLYQYSGACAISVPLTGQTFTDMITSTIQLAASIGATVASGGAAAGITAASAANSVMSMKPQIERAGGVSGAAGQLGVMTPYLIAEVPRQSVPKNYNTFAGYPSNIKATLGDLSGYTEIETVYLKDIAATKTELDEIETLLKSGVII